jgi:ferrous iron transport protein B
MSQFALIGKPNCGKSLLFNKLTGLMQKVANYPGVTVSLQTGSFKEHTIIDFPGTYSLHSISEDERVAVSKFLEMIETGELNKIIVILDGTRLEQSLLLGLQIQQRLRGQKIPLLFAINMLDVLEANQLSIDTKTLSEDLGVEIISFSAKTNKNLSEIKNWLNKSEHKFSDVPERSDKEIQVLNSELARKYAPSAKILLRKQERLDAIFLSNIWGGFLFILIMLILFQSIFTWAIPMMDLIDWIVSGTGQWTVSHFDKGLVHSFLSEAIFGGIGSFIVFVPQIFVLTFIIGLLEDSGYLSRMALICHRPLQFFGLSGKSAIPLLTGHACAIPAIYAARTIASPKKRFLTLLAVPLISCSARLPVYGLLIAVAIPTTTIAGGLIGYQGIAFFGLYFLGIIGALFVSALLSRFSLKKVEDTPLVLELPNYRLPKLIPLMKHSAQMAWKFITQAGWVIFSVNTIIWVLGYFPNGEGQLDSSYLAAMGHFFEPMFAPLGLDWKFTVAIIMSFLAREVFVGALGTMFGLEDNDELSTNLADKLQADGLSMASSVSLLIFYVFAMQCVATLAVLRQELGNSKAPVLIFLGYNLGAYILALGCYLLLV